MLGWTWWTIDCIQIQMYVDKLSFSHLKNRKYLFLNSGLVQICDLLPPENEFCHRFWKNAEVLSSIWACDILDVFSFICHCPKHKSKHFSSLLISPRRSDQSHKNKTSRLVWLKFCKDWLKLPLLAKKRLLYQFHVYECDNDFLFRSLLN